MWCNPKGQCGKEMTKRIPRGLDLENLQADKDKFVLQLRQAQQQVIESSPQVNAIRGILTYISQKIDELTKEVHSDTTPND